MEKYIVVIGSSNIDLIMKMPRLPRVGETVTEAVFMQTFGGKGANQAVGAARAGGKVAFVNCVGDDMYGQQVIENMRREGINVDCVSEEQGVATGTALIMVGGLGENYLSVAPGANYRLDKSHIDQARDLIEGAGMVLFQYEIKPEALAYAIDLVSTIGAPIMLNLAPARAIHDATLRKVTILVVNETEAEFLCGFAVDSNDRLRDVASVLLGKGPLLVILTLGAQGAYVANDKEQFLVPAFKVEPVDTTAAGDVFCGSLAVALAEGQNVREAVRFANAAAAIAVTRLGAQPSAPYRAEIDQFLQR